MSNDLIYHIYAYKMEYTKQSYKRTAQQKHFPLSEYCPKDPTVFRKLGLDHAVYPPQGEAYRSLGSRMTYLGTAELCFGLQGASLPSLYSGLHTVAVYIATMEGGSERRFYCYSDLTFV